MSFITRLKQRFSGKAAKQSIGLAFQRAGVGVCYIPSLVVTQAQAEQQASAVAEKAAEEALDTPENTSEEIDTNFATKDTVDSLAVALAKQSQAERAQIEESPDPTPAANPLKSNGLFLNLEGTPGDKSEAIANIATSDLTGDCFVVLPSDQVKIVQIDKPMVPEADLAQALKWQVKDYVTVGAEDLVLDYFDSPVLLNGVEKVNVVCASKRQILPILEGIHGSNISIKKIICEEFAFAQLVPVQEEAVLLLCQQPDEELLIIIVKNGQIWFNRHLRGFAQVGNFEDQELSDSAEKLSLELQRASDFFERQLKQAAVTEVQVLVPIEKEAYLARKLAENSNVPVTLFKMPEGYEDQRGYAASIGATVVQEEVKNG
ncbi:hypothetical protein [Thalassotalea agarivorans]|uniref:MSHA biogenesis protein MshI n=1 Tax=Thalassotalea agarivorans TaxID=349064 RepID=A0A1I0G133_THASX|nr:hypothetical protein [Thalassotalea agarivorans]SET64433.1 hypothetical protein SAMN05660429_02311 [Thalassotalea agarivorans]